MWIPVKFYVKENCLQSVVYSTLSILQDRLSPRSDGEPPQPPADPPLVDVEGSSDEGVPGGGAEPSDQQVVEVPDESEGGTVEIDCQHSPDQRGESTDQSEKILAQNNDTSKESQQISAEIPQSPGKLLIKDGKEKAEKRKRNKDPAAVESLRNTVRESEELVLNFPGFLSFYCWPWPIREPILIRKCWNSTVPIRMAWDTLENTERIA